MTRFLLLPVCVLTCALLAVPTHADDPPKKLTDDERNALEAKLKELNAAGVKAYQAEKYAEAAKSFEEGLKVARQLYSATEFPDGHSNLATSLNNLGALYRSQGKHAAAEPLYADALATRKRLFKGDHSDVAQSLNDLGALYHFQGKHAAAEPLYADALAMRKRLFKGDHPDVAVSLDNLGLLYEAKGKLAAAEPLYADALAMRKRLFKGDHPAVAVSLNNLGLLYRFQGKLAAAEPLYADALAMRKRLFKGDHPAVAQSLNNLATLYEAQGRLAAAEPLLTDALAMRKRLFEGDHPAVAVSLNNLGLLYQSQGRHATAEPLYADALAMRKRLFKGDHSEVVKSLNNLGLLYRSQGRLAAAEPLLTDALAMSKRLFEGDHPDVAVSLNNLGLLYRFQRKHAAAEPLYADALAMHKRLFKGDHPAVAQSLNNLATLYDVQGRHAAAEPLYADALAMRKRLFKGDHPDLAESLGDLAGFYRTQSKFADAEPLFIDALAMFRRLTTTFAQDKSEGETLTLLADQQLTRDGFLCNEQARKADPASVYLQLWAEKGYVSRAYERRQLQARAASSDPTAAKLLADLTDARLHRAELLLAPTPKDPATRNKDIKTYDQRIEARTRELKTRLPAIARIETLDAATPTRLQKVLPAGCAVVDFLNYTHFTQDKDKPGAAGEMWTPRYLAFVVTPEAVAWADLGAAADIEAAIEAWRGAIGSGKDIPASLPTKVRELVWAKVRKELPATTRTVYVCPDAALCKVPFAALPGDKPGTILLEDFAVAMIPHAPFLLDKLLPAEKRKNPPAGTLVVGGVRYDAELPALAGPKPADPLVKPGAKLGWGFLPNTVGEADGVAATAIRKKLTATRLDGGKATPTAVLAELPKAKYAHFATHGFFADPSFRGPFQLDEKDFEMRGGERVGRAVNSPLLMTGLVFAGANDPKAPGRGVLTGEALIDLDLSGLDLAVLSACETGLGDVAGGQGVFGLQRAFHYAGATNVVCSLWKVPDESTAALMNLFYQNLWDKNLSPMEALRQAQLHLYRNPGDIPGLAKGFRGKFEVVPGMGGEVAIKPGKDGKAHPLLWAAFTLSGPGR